MGSIHFPVNVVFLGIVSACARESTEVFAPVRSCQFGPAWQGGEWEAGGE